MAPFRTFAAVSSLSGALAVRVAKDDQETLSTAGLEEKRATTRPQLQLFASTFNAGNSQYSAEQTSELLRMLVHGHDEPGREADIVFLGLQEYTEARVSVASAGCEAVLWPELSRRAGRLLTEELQQVASAPPHLHGLKAELAGDLAAFHGQLGAESHAFTQHYGPLDHDFHHHISRSSHIARLEEQSRLLSRDVNGRVESALANVQTYKTQVSDRKFDSLRTHASTLSNMAQSFDPDRVTSKLAPIREWTASAVAAIAAARARHPNMVLNAAGEQAMSEFLSSIDNVDGLQASLVDRHFQEQVTASIADLHRNISQQVEHAEGEMQSRVLADLARLTADTEHLVDDIRQIESERHLNIARAASDGVEAGQARIRSSTDAWASESRENIGGLLQPGSMDFTAGHLDVKSETEFWNAGWRCHSGSHYDTTLHAFINPWSNWRIEQVDYDSAVCRKAGQGRGCTINNNIGWECGKVVNMQVFEAQKGEDTIRVCAMNTHMSFSNAAANRMESIAAAVGEAAAANCDSLVFVGDFNSRSHCHVSWETDEVLPPYERLDVATNSSLNYLMDEFCRGSSCSNGGPKRFWDELTQMVESTGQLECFEEDSANPNGWSLRAVENLIPALGLREAGPVSFAPTYKMKPPERAAREGHYHRCLSGEPTCFANTDRKGKHNPAWTDRILLQNSDRVSLHTYEYSRRPVAPEFDTDHIPVVARVTLELV